MKNNFQDCLQRVLKDEGGYTNDPQDPGGPTNYGITIIDVRKYINKNATAQDVRNLTLDQAKDIYKSKYWDALGCDDLPSGVDYTCFDYGVNSGLGRPRKTLQRFSNLSGAQLIQAINNERTTFLRSLSTFPRFGKGWIARVNRVNAYSLQLAKKKDTISGTVTTGGVTTAGVAISQYFHEHMFAIISGTVIAAILIGALVHYLRNRQ